MNVQIKNDIQIRRLGWMDFHRIEWMNLSIKKDKMNGCTNKMDIMNRFTNEKDIMNGYKNKKG